MTGRKKCLCLIKDIVEKGIKGGTEFLVLQGCHWSLFWFSPSPGCQSSIEFTLSPSFFPCFF